MLRNICVFFLSVICMAVHGQSKEILLSEVKKSQENLRMFLQFSNLQIKLEPAAVVFDPKDDFNFEQKDPNAGTTLDATLQAFFSTIRINNTLLPPNNFLSLEKDKFKLTQLLGVENSYFLDHADKEPRYTPTQIHFLDQTSIEAKGQYTTKEALIAKYGRTDAEGYADIDSTKLSDADRFLLHNASSFDQDFLVHAAKPIKAIDMEITLPLREHRLHLLTPAQNKLSTPSGTISLIAMEENKALLEVPAVLEKDIQIQALYQDGRRLKQRSSNSRTSITKEKRVQYKTLLQVLEQAQTTIEKDKITNQDQLTAYIQKQSGLEFNRPEELGNTQIELTFSGPIAQIELKIWDTAEKLFTTHLTYPIAYYNQQDPYIAADLKTGRVGLLDRTGKWVVEPKFNNNFRPINAYFYWDQIDDEGQTYHFNPTTKTLHPVNYQIDDPTIYQEKYVKIETKTNGPIGMVDATTGKIMIPMQHELLHFNAPGFWIANQQNSEKEGAYTNQGEILLPFRFDHVKYENGFFYTEYNPTEYIYDEQKNVFNNKGQNITNGKYSEIKGTFADGLLLVTKEIREPKTKDIKGIHYFFIDSTGHEVLSFPTEKYHLAEPFYKGLARVEKRNNDEYLYDGDYGFIDNKGREVIPTMYDNATDFHGKYAYVAIKKQDQYTYAFIDRKNNIVMKLPSGYQYSWYDEKKQKWYIRLGDEEVYDYDGNPIKAE
ncbi:WG repeat-containing protein [Sphingobacterium sp. SRCM116780]|uniref:WG repeat-containing protein n=1 Tax=Sphingobacterium sp. SRCM116780 TaxID=2907623 RepID=UPI001F366139|nr:WG repeat-containing protein [Sphingobacterium sp. SRCM116780]UIR57361.1 WG repeat-containing protein [Sphingobacterium sp. SRCM116780]